MLVHIERGEVVVEVSSQPPPIPLLTLSTPQLVIHTPSQGHPLSIVVLLLSCLPTDRFMSVGFRLA